MTIFNKQLVSLYRILDANWPWLKMDPKLCIYVSEKPQMLARWAPNLKDKLVRGHFTRCRGVIEPRQILGTFPCGHCNICQYMIADKGFMDPQRGKCFTLRHFIYCKTRNVIYALICLCNRIYVGQTFQELRKRMRLHLSNVGLASQCTSCGRRDMGEWDGGWFYFYFT